ncbi:hypothetical protein TRIUR3_12174 [Triticum urartu]|uniref:Uncharacterized protein n=1 Tax=Triticum urartu TaxID=4572 RepID=M8AS19_TRIUA|nr:hypothetical protein TRIUR3_12174 [Triticum urartu]
MHGKFGNLETIKEMSNDEYTQILRHILKRVYAGDGAAANLGPLKNGDSTGGGWSRGSSCAIGSDGSTMSRSFVTGELEDIQGRKCSSPLSRG